MVRAHPTVPPRSVPISTAPPCSPPRWRDTCAVTCCLPLLAKTQRFTHNSGNHCLESFPLGGRCRFSGSGIYAFERYIDATTMPDFEPVAVDWIANGVDRTK